MHIVHFKNMLARGCRLPSMELSQVHIYHVTAAMKSFIYYNPEDTRNMELKQEILTRLQDTVTDPTQAELIVVLWWDGTMIKAIQEMKQYDLPFFGVNCGTLGFLLNDVSSVDEMPTTLTWLQAITEPYIEATVKTKTETHHVYAVNDIDINPARSKYPTLTISKPGMPNIKTVQWWLIISSAIGSTGSWVNHKWPMLPTGQNDIGLMGVGTGTFDYSIMMGPFPYTVDIQSRQPIDITVDGEYTTIHDADSISYQPSKETFTLLFRDNFDQKRLILHSSKLNRIL